MVKQILYVFLIAGLVATATPAAEILIYGPSLDTTAQTDAQTVAEGEGHTVTVFDSGQWAGASAATFASFDAIVIDDDGCNSDMTVLDGALANHAVWGPEITGNAVLHTFDPGAHADSNPEGVTLTANGINWAASGGGTGFYLTTGCYLDGDGSFTITGLGTFDFTDTSGDLVVIQDAGHPVMAGLTNGGLSDWASSVHGHFTGFPGDFAVLAVEQEDQTPDAVILARESQVVPALGTVALALLAMLLVGGGLLAIRR